MLSLDTLIRALPAPPDVRALVPEFIPPPRFREKTFDNYHPAPRHPSQRAALERLHAVADRLRADAGRGLAGRIRVALGRGEPGGGVYLDGGFGVGKTHLLAALWNAAPPPRAYLSFDELVYTIGLLGVGRAREAFRDHRLVTVDEWELDDPGNLKLALAFLRGAVEDGVRLAVTSNTVPDELGRGRFSQKDFAVEIEELAEVFEVLRIGGEDYRHRHFAADPGREYFTEPEVLVRGTEREAQALLVAFDALLAALADLHPIRYAALVDSLDVLLIRDLAPVPHLPDALRWVHFVDKLYDADVPLAASAAIPLSALFPPSFLGGPYAKKFGRCLSRMEELLTPPVVPVRAGA